MREEIRPADEEQQPAADHRQCLHQHKAGEQRQHRLDQIEPGPAAGLGGGLEHAPGQAHKRQARPEQQHEPGGQEQRAAGDLDPGPGARGQALVQDLDPDVAVGGVGIGCRQQEADREADDVELLQPDPAEAEQIAGESDAGKISTVASTNQAALRPIRRIRRSFVGARRRRRRAWAGLRAARLLAPSRVGGSSPDGPRNTGWHRTPVRRPGDAGDSRLPVRRWPRPRSCPIG